MSRYQGMVLSGRAYSAATSNASASFVTTPSSAPPFALYNPIGSGVNVVLWRASFGFYGTAVTSGVGVICLAANTNTAAAATTSSSSALTAVPNFLGNVMGFAAKAQAFVATITLPAAPTLLRGLFAVNAVTNTTAIYNEPVDIDLAGDIVLAPGSTVSFQAIGGTAGTPGTYNFGLSWAEIPLAS